MSSPKPNFVDVSNQGRKSIIWQYLLLAKEKDLAKQKLSSKPAKAAETTETVEAVVQKSLTKNQC